MKGGFCSILKSIISKFLLIIFIIIIISINGCNDLINSTQYGTATIKGKVINAVDSTGIGGATIRCNTTYTTNTDSLGNYIVNNVYPGNTAAVYKIYVTHNSFFPDSLVINCYELQTSIANFKLRPKP